MVSVSVIILNVFPVFSIPEPAVISTACKYFVKVPLFDGVCS